MQQPLNEHRRLKYLQAMGIPVWVRRLPEDEVGETVFTMPAVNQNVPDNIPQRSASLAQGMRGMQKIHEALEQNEETTESLPNANLKNVVSTADLIDCSKMDWQALQAHITSCQSCGLYRSRSQAVMGSGDTSAEYLIIGDTPSADDDRRGHPFQGQAGKLLTNMLLAIDLPREAVYLANTLKCRPPNNRPPLEDELMQCQQALFRQIDLVKPKAMLILGRVTAQSLLKSKAPLSRLRGQVHSLSFEGVKNEIPTVVTYHPKTLLKQTKDKRKAWEDLKLFKNINTPT